MYAKLTDGALEIAPKNYTDNNTIICNFNLDESIMRKYGYKPVIEAEKPNYPYTLSYKETEEDIIEIVSPDIKTAKQNKITENDSLRDEKLLSGVTYNNVLFDSDTEQKTNLTAKYLMMSDDDTVTWFGMDNKALLCTKQDLLAIGNLIETLHTFCWENNAYIKEQIAQAETIEEVESIEIDYNRKE